MRASDVLFQRFAIYHPRSSPLEGIRFYFFLNENEYPQRYSCDFELYEVAGFTLETGKREITALALINHVV